MRVEFSIPAGESERWGSNVAEDMFGKQVAVRDTVGNQIAEECSIVSAMVSPDGMELRLMMDIPDDFFRSVQDLSGLRLAKAG